MNPSAAEPISHGLEPTATVSRGRAYELLAHLIASADICAVEPGYYGTFRLLDAASKLAEMVLGCGLEDPWLTQFQADLDRNKMLMMSDRDAYYAYLPQAARQVAQRLIETEPDDNDAGEP